MKKRVRKYITTVRDEPTCCSTHVGLTSIQTWATRSFELSNAGVWTGRELDFHVLVLTDVGLREVHLTITDT